MGRNPPARGRCLARVCGLAGGLVPEVRCRRRVERPVFIFALVPCGRPDALLSLALSLWAQGDGPGG